MFPDGVYIVCTALRFGVGIEEDFEVLFGKIEERMHWISGIIVYYAFTLDRCCSKHLT